MRDELLKLYGELMELKRREGDWFVKRRYEEKMKAIEILLQPMPFDAINPVDEL